jgi:uncharacterized protein (TIGR03435 family)
MGYSTAYGVVLVLAVSAYGQTRSTSTFEVATVKVNKEGGGSGMAPSPGRLRVTNYTLRQLIEAAYHMPAGRVFGVTGWMDSERYDIDAKTPAASDFDNELLMLLPLIEERFHIRFHTETRRLRTLALVAAKGGAKLQPSKDGAQSQTSIRPTEIVGTKMSLGHLVSILSAQLNTSVTNETGLTGEYDIHLKFAREDSPAAAAGEPTIFAVLERDLGLKLEPRRGEVEVLVIDSAKKPEN